MPAVPSPESAPADDAPSLARTANAVAHRSDRAIDLSAGEPPRVSPLLTLRALVRYFLGLGTWGFGGPVVLVERMRRDLQESRGWFTVAEYKEAIALAQLAPGPLAAQVAIYLGWLRAGLLGATAVGVAFIAPSFLMVLVLSAVYVEFGGLTWMQGAFYGVGAAVIAIIGFSAWKLVRKTVGKDALLWGVVAVNVVATAVTEREILSLIVASGLLVLAVRGWPRRGATAALVVLPSWLLTGLHGTAEPGLLTTIGWYFAKAGALVFGSGLAIVPFLHGGTVVDMHWLTERQFLDAVAVSMITPGPVVITVAFIGYLVAGPLGAIAAAIGVFLPAYLMVVLVAAWFQRVAQNRSLRAAVDGVTAAATGAIGGAVIVLGRRAIVDGPTLFMFAAALAVVLWVRKVPEPVLLLAAGLAGILFHGAI
jgi:chromate transporter